MALLNRLFPSKKKNQKQGYVSFGKNESLSWKPFNFTKEHVRVLLFRECDARGRKLLFDSSAVLKVPLENNRPTKHKFCPRPKCDTSKKTETYVEMTNGFGYQYTRPNCDVTLLGEMVFGSVAMMFRGMTLKVHSMKTPHRLMCTKVFHMPLASSHSKRKSDQSIEDSCGSSISSVSDYAFSQVPQSEIKQGSSYASGPLDVPNCERTGKPAFGSLEGDSGFCGDASLHSISSIGSGGYWPLCPGGTEPVNALSFISNNSHSGSSLASIQRRWIRNINTSLETVNLNTPLCFIKSRTSSGRLSCDEGFGRNQRKTQLGLTVIVSLSSQEERDMEVFFFEHMAVIESMMDRLQHTVEKAYSKKDTFVHLMMEAYSEIQQWLYDLFTAPRLSCPIWMNLSSPLGSYQGCSHSQFSVTSLFLRDLCQLITTIDTKATNFFVSTLVTAVLTHHLGWVATILPIKAPPNSVTKQPCTDQMLDALAKSHPYNALWAQLGDLHGALGNPVKVARTIVTATSKKSDLLNKLLSVLSYFIRCGNIEKRIDNLLMSEAETGVLDSIIENLSLQSLSSNGATLIGKEPENSQESLAVDSSVVPSSSINAIPRKELTSPINHKATTNITKLEKADNALKVTSAGNNSVCCEMTGLQTETKCAQHLNDIVDHACNVNKEKIQLHNTPIFTSVEESSKVPVKSCSQQGDNSWTLKKSPRIFNKLNSSPSLIIGEQEKMTNSELFSDSSNVEERKELRTYLHPDIISEKVNRLCRVPVNAVLYHMSGENFQNSSFVSYLPKKTDCERQLSSLSVSKDDGPLLTQFTTEETECSFKENWPSDKSQNKPVTNVNSDGVLFVLGENETLRDLKSQNGSSIHKSKSDNVLCEENVNTKVNGMKKTNCYPSLNELLHSGQKMSVNYGKESSLITTHLENRNNLLTSRILNCKDFDCHTYDSTSMKVPKNNVTLSIPNVRNNQTFKEKISTQNEEKVKSRDILGDKLLLNHFSDDKENTSSINQKIMKDCSRVVTSHSSVIELEEEHGNTEIKIGADRGKSCKSVVRSQSLSFPVRVFKRKAGRICRRHSEYIHEGNRFLKDYHSVRFNFERCDSVLDDYVDRIGVDKSPCSEKKSLKLSEARGNFEAQKLCENCINLPRTMCFNPVLCDESLCSCAKRCDKYECGNHSAEIHLDRKSDCVQFDECEALSNDKVGSPLDMQETTTVKPHRTLENHPILLNLPLPRHTFPQQEQTCGFAASLLGGVVDHYVPDLILHGCTQEISNWEATLKQDLTLAAYHSILDQDISEAVCIVGNADEWEVQLVSSHGSFVDKPGAFGVRVGMSQLVANMLESLSHLWKLRTPPEQCLRHLESKLRELCLRSQALAELLLTTDFCDMATVTSSLGLEANDVPLLLAIASVHTPQVTCHYGLSFR